MITVGKHTVTKEGYTADYTGQGLPFSAVHVSYDGVLFVQHFRRYPYIGGEARGHTRYNIERSRPAAPGLERASIVTDLTSTDPVEYYKSYIQEVSEFRAEVLIRVMDFVGLAWRIRDRDDIPGRHGALLIDFEHPDTKDTLNWLYNRFTTWPLHGYNLRPNCNALWTMIRLNATTN
jgi:hypothetical protein